MTPMGAQGAMKSGHSGLGPWSRWMTLSGGVDGGWGGMIVGWRGPSDPLPPGKQVAPTGSVDIPCVV